MNIQYCMNCFAPLEGNEECPNCKFNLKNYVSDPQYLPPETILHGRYLVGRVLGEGGFGITYLGFDLSLERKVAVKEYFPSGSVWRDSASGLTVNCNNTKSVADAFAVGKEKCMKEAQAIAKLDDIDSVVRVLEHFPENNTAYVIMEYIDGVTLKDYAQSLPSGMSFEDAMKLMMPVMQALSVVHKRGFIHRDISPDNIMITPDGKAKLLDFGAVKYISSGNSFTENPTIKRGFSALEQYSSAGMLGEWTDVYAICATIFYLLTGRIVPEPMERLGPNGDHVAEMLKGTLPDDAYLALLQGLAVQPKDRLQTMDELIARLDSVIPKQGVGEKSFFYRNRKWLVPVAAVLVAAVAALTVFAVFRQNAEPVDNKKYTYGRNIANMFSDGMMVNAGDVNYITDYYDAENAYIYSLDESANVTVVADTGYSLNYLGNTLYYVRYADRAVYSAESNGEGGYVTSQVYSGSAVGQLLAVGIDGKEYLYFTEPVGELVYIQRMDLETKEKITVSSGYKGMQFSVHNSKLYYINDKHELWTVGMDGKNETAVIKDSKTEIFSFCFVDDKLYLQTEKVIAVADEKGHIESILPGVSPLYYISEQICSPVIGDDGKLYYTDKDSKHLFQYDISTKEAKEIVAATCCDFEIATGSLIYTTKDTDVFTIHVLDGDLQPQPISMWKLRKAEDYSYGVPDYGNAVNESFVAAANNRLYYTVCGQLYVSEMGKGKSTTLTTESTSGSGQFSCINFSSDEKLYVVKTDESTSAIIAPDGTAVYTGNDIHSFQYYKRDDFEKLLFTDKDENGDCYAYSINTDGTVKTRISHVPCAPNTLDIYEDYIIYTDVSRTRLYAAYVSGQQIWESYEIYAVPDEKYAINQASFKDENLIYISLNGTENQNRLVSVSALGEVKSDEQADVGRFVFCDGKLYATEPKTSNLYCYPSPETDLTERSLISDYRVDAVNMVTYNKQTAVVFRSYSTGYSYIVDPADLKAHSMSAFDLNKIFNVS